MTLPRRQFLYLAAGAAALPGHPRVVQAQAYPSRPARIIVGFPAGGVSDIVGRVVGQWLSERLGKPFVIENRPGAGSNLGTEMVVNAPPDGYTLLLLASANAINATLYEKLNFNFINDIAPVASLARFPLVMEVNPQLPVQSVPEFIAYAKTNPGKLNMASAGIGATSHLAGELFKLMAGVDMVHVPYRGSSLALPDLIGGRVQVMFDNTASSIEHIRAGRVRPLAVTSATRLQQLSELPTVAETLPGYEASLMVGVGAPRNTPVQIINTLNIEINAGLADSKIKAQLADLGATVFASSPAELGKFIADETEKWARVIRTANIKAQ